MNKYSTVSFFTLIIAIFASSLFFAAPAYGIGQITTPIVIPNAIRGEEVAADLVFVNSDITKGNFKLSASGEIGNWTTFYTATDKKNKIADIFSILANTQMGAVAIFTIPMDIPNGTYKGVVTVETVPDVETTSDSTHISVGQTISRSVSITITEKEDVAASVSIIPLKYTFSPKEKLNLTIHVRNTGNITIKPSVRLNITEAGNSIFDVIYPYPNTKDVIKPSTTVTLDPIQWQPMDGKLGDFVANVEVLVGDVSVGKSVIPFTVVADRNMFLASIENFANGSMWSITLMLVGILALLTFGFLKFGKKFLNRKKNSQTIL
ncbi:MAG: hypothetical protein WCX69_02115 [Candidatus Paceibacterota bacterium]